MPYSGGKQTVAQEIAALLPGHVHYVEPFGGALSVLLAKTPSPLETVNDINGDLVAFWRVLRDRTEELAWVCALTPHSRQEYRSCRDLPPAADEVEQARRVWVQLTQSRGARQGGSGWRFLHGTGRFTLARYLDGYLARIAPAAQRLRTVSLECRDAFDVIACFGRADACLYVDPPYLGEVRYGPQYRHELADAGAHQRLLEALTATPAAVVLSGYAHPLYDEALVGWRRYTFAAASMRGDARVEVVWVNREPAAQPTLWEAS